MGDGRVGLYAGFCPRVPRGIPMGGHPSRPAVAGRLQRSTRRHRAGSPRTPAQDGGATAVPLDLAPGGVYRAAPVTRCAGGLLHHRFTLTSGEPPAVCSLWHCPAGHPGSPLATTLPCGARTFLGGGISPADATAQPTRPSCPQSRHSPARHRAPVAPGRGRPESRPPRRHAGTSDDTRTTTGQLADPTGPPLSQVHNAHTFSASGRPSPPPPGGTAPDRSEEHTSELQSRQYLVCRLLLEKKKKYHLPSNLK